MSELALEQFLDDAARAAAGRPAATTVGPPGETSEGASP